MGKKHRWMKKPLKGVSGQKGPLDKKASGYKGIWVKRPLDKKPLIK